MVAKASDGVGVVSARIDRVQVKRVRAMIPVAEHKAKTRGAAPGHTQNGARARDNCALPPNASSAIIALLTIPDNWLGRCYMADDELDLSTLSDDDLVAQMHDDLYDGLRRRSRRAFASCWTAAGRPTRC